MRISGFGQVLFGIGAAGLAILALAYGNFAPLLDPFPALLPRPQAWADASAAILLAASAGLFFARTAPTGAILIAGFEVVWVATRARAIFLQPLSIGSWYGVCEALGPLLGAWILYGLLRRGQANARIAPAMTGGRAVRVAQALFGAACVGYGAAHFAYATYTAAMVPRWFPDRLALAYLTGACHTAAGLGLLLGVVPRLAATLEAVMLSLFGILVWLPTFFAHAVPPWASPRQVQWSETFLTALLAGAAWIVAES